MRSRDLGICACFMLASTTVAQQNVSYDVGGDSVFLKGCFPPCMCPLSVSELAGSFTLSLAETSPEITMYEVRNLVLVATTQETFVTLVGEGTYSIAGPKGSLQRLELEVTVGIDPSEHFDSGWLPVIAEWPAIQIVAPMGDMTCFDQVLDIAAVPAPASTADLDGDGKVDGTDLGYLLSSWNSCVILAPCFGDLDGDGQIGAADLGILLGAWTG